MERGGKAVLKGRKEAMGGLSWVGGWRDVEVLGTCEVEGDCGA